MNLKSSNPEGVAAYQPRATRGVWSLDKIQADLSKNLCSPEVDMRHIYRKIDPTLHFFWVFMHFYSELPD